MYHWSNCVSKLARRARRETPGVGRTGYILVMMAPRITPTGQGQCLRKGDVVCDNDEHSVHVPRKQLMTTFGVGGYVTEVDSDGNGRQGCCSSA